MSEEQRRRWEWWMRTGNALFVERLVEFTLGENPRLRAAEAAHKRACDAIQSADRSEAIEGRWCGQEVVWCDDYCKGRCGGELLYRRRLEGEQIVSYLICQFCGHLTPVLTCDTVTGEHTDLIAAEQK